MSKMDKQPSLFDFDSLDSFIKTNTEVAINTDIPDKKQEQPDIESIKAKLKAVEKQEVKINKIEDVGEKIGGARKDFAKKGLTISDYSTMNAVERIKNVKRDNIWKMPKPQTLMESGCNPYIFLYANEIRKTITQDPHKATRSIDDEKLSAFIKFTTFVKDTLEKTFHEETLGEAQDHLKSQMIGTYFEKIKERNGRTAYKLTDEAVKIEEFAQLGIYKDKAKLFDLVFNPQLFNHEGVFNKEWDEILTKKNNNTLKDEVEKDTDLKTLIKESYYLTHLERKGKDYRKDREEELTAEDFMETFGFRGVEFGNWLRQTKTTNERQEVLNHAFDAFKDLAKALGVSDKAMGMNGKLAIAFGSRGKGGKGSFAAHYEPGRMVINMTKIHGSGSLAHEWMHSLDNFLGTKMLGKNQGVSLRYASSDFDSSAGFEYMKKLEADQPKVHSAIKMFEQTKLSIMYQNARHYLAQGLTDTLYSKIETAKMYENKAKASRLKRKKENYTRRKVHVLSDIGGITRFYASGIASDLKKSKNKIYWGEDIELMARAFEVYVIDKLDKLNMRSDYLVSHTKGNENFLKEIKFKIDGEEKEGISDTYPAGSERRMFEQYFDTMMEATKMSELFEIEKPTESTSEIKSITIGDEKLTLLRDNDKMDNIMRYDAVLENLITGEKKGLGSISDTLDRVDNQYHLEIARMAERKNDKKIEVEKRSKPHPIG